MLTLLQKLFPAASGTELNYKTPWQLLIAVILSSQCTDKKVNEVTQVLFKKYKSLEQVANARQQDFEKDIYSTGFYRSKAKHIIAAAKQINERFGGKIPSRMDDLLTIPGVARKTANVVLGNAYHSNQGIAVDTHVRRLALLHGLTIHHDPVKIEKDLMRIIAKKDWFRFSNYMVLYGRYYCKAKKHTHDVCSLNKI